MSTKPLVCKLTSPGLRQRRATIIRELKHLVINREVLPNGLRFEFAGKDDILDSLIDFIKSERLCCEFLSFQLSVADDTATLALLGPEGTREFLEQEIGM